MANLASTSPEPRLAPSDKELVQRLRQGDEQAFEQLVRAQGPRLLTVARRILGNEEDAREVVQEAFLSAHKSLDGFSGDSQLSTWLHRIVINAALMRARRLKKSSEKTITDLLPQFNSNGYPTEPVADWSETAERTLEKAEARAQVRHAIDQLPESHRTVLLLRDIEELSTEETAQQLGIKPGAVKTRLHRARQALRALLEPHFQRGES